MRKIHTLGGLLLALFFGLGLPLALLLGGCYYRGDKTVHADGSITYRTEAAFLDDISTKYHKGADGTVDLERGSVVSPQASAMTEAFARGIAQGLVKGALPVASGAESVPPVVPAPVPTPAPAKPPIADLRGPVPDLAPKPAGP